MSKTPSLQVILPHDYELAILIVPHASGWTLPSVELKEWPEIGFELFNAAMENRSILGHATITLRCPYFERPNDEHGYRFVFVVQNQDNPFQTPEGGRWLKQDDLKNLEINDEYLRPVIEIYFSEQVTGKVPVQRSPWAFAGWREKATDWIKMQVAAQNWQIETDIELTRQWCITCVLKASTSVGNLYFKAVLPIFGREISIIRYLAQKHPLHIPTFVAYHDEKHWMLMRDFGSELLGDNKEIANWERAVREFAALQNNMMPHVESLFEHGALDYRLEILVEKFEALLADTLFLLPDRHITAEEIEQARRIVPRVKELIQEMYAYNIPSTIVHGDFHPWNIAIHEGHTVFFDWTDAAVGNPFFDMSLFFDRVSQEVFADAPETVAHLKQLYLQELTHLAPLETLQKAFSLGLTLGLLHQALAYHYLLPHVEPLERWSLNFIGFYVKRFLDAVQAIDKVP